MARILIFAESVSLAHVARPIAVARILRELGHDVGFAASLEAGVWLAAEGVPILAIHSISAREFQAALARGSPI